MASQVLIGMGANLGNRWGNLRRAIAALQENCGQVVAVSSCYESEPVGGFANQRFLNAVLCCATSFTPVELWLRLLTIELQLGRVPTQHHWANRTIDLDILLWQSSDGTAAQMHLPTLKIPHPRMLSRDFVMLPAAEIASHWRYPNNLQLLAEIPLPPTSVLRRLPQEL